MTPRKMISLTVLPHTRSRTILVSILSVGVGVLAMPADARGQSQSVLSFLSTEGRSLSVGHEVTGALSSSDPRAPDDAPLEAWSLEGHVGQAVTIDMRSTDFDAYLYLVGPGFNETLRDDDGAGGCNARLALTFLETGSFMVVASGQSGQTGPYTLSVSADPEPAAPYSCGGVNPAALLELPIEDRNLAGLGAAWGSFDGTEPTIQDRLPAAAWALQGRGGESITVRLGSDDFDAYLHVFGPGMTEVESDDDGAGDLNSQITVEFPHTDTYLVVASALSSGARGTYTLELTEPLDLSTLPTAGRRAVVGETVSSLLSPSLPVVMDGRPAEAWALEGRRGDSVTIELLAKDFDPYLYLVGPGLDQPLEDDDGAGDTNSRIRVTFPESGTYRVIVSAFSSGSGGSFDIRVLPN